MNYIKYKNRTLRHWLSAPFIWGVLPALILFDIFLEIYHRISFYLYELPHVRREEYIQIDRHKLSYLKTYQKIFCLYCGYANGLIHYAARIAGDTEQYWCSITHQKKNKFIAPPHHKDFIPYGDIEAFNQYVEK